MAIIKHIIFLIVFLTLASISTAQINPALLSYRLALFWPEGLCKTKSSGCIPDVEIPDKFTIHGLWPVYLDKNYPDSDEKYNNDIVENIVGIKELWPRVNGKPEHYYKLWRNEWERHGKRAGLFGLHNYFQYTMELFRESHTMEIVVNAGKPRTPATMRAAFPGREPNVLCKEGNDGGSYMFSLEFCLDGTRNYVNCGPDKDHKCPDGEEFSY